MKKSSKAKLSSSAGKATTTSPRASPLLQFFSMPKGGTSAPTSPTSPSGGDENDSVVSAASSTILRSISQCFDGGIGEDGGEGLELSEEEQRTIDKARKVDVKNESKKNGGQYQWGPSHSISSEEVQDNKQGKTSSPSGFATGFNNLFKPTASKKSSPKNNHASSTSSPPSPTKSRGGSSHSTSHKTDPTVPVTTSTMTGEGGHYQQSHQFSMKTGMASMPATPRSKANTTSNTNNTTTTGAMGGSASAAVITNFWNNHAQPATSYSCAGGGGGSGGGGMMMMDAASSPSSAASSLHSATISPITTSAKAAADAVMGMISRAENFIVTSTGVSPDTGFCSPRGSPTNDGSLAMEGIPEGDEQLHGDEQQCGDNVCGGGSRARGINDNHCFEFEDFGFNAFQLDEKKREAHGAGHSEIESSPIREKGQDNKSLISPSQTKNDASEQQQQPKGYEIRLKSSFSQIKAQKEMQKDANNQRKPLAATSFGRTHPNNNNSNDHNNNNGYKKSISQPNIDNKQRPMQDYPDVPQGSSRALPDGLPFQELSVPNEIERSVSELTMRSHGAFERHRYASDSRRMAYYAVGRTAPPEDSDNKNLGNAGGGNRRCYFTGHGIPYGMPFYAGSVQQGPRTLVVFCLPAALGLPVFSNLQAMQRPLHRFSNAADRERYLEALPEPDAALLQEMSRRYPEPFDTLPVQVRSPHCWRLFVKFCFFSGLPIAEGEMHYRVKSSVNVFHPTMSLALQEQQGEEIALSHEVMEAVNGEVSAEILRLPNQKVFDYLKRQYSQQSSKLNEEVFDRKSWELVMPEV